MVRLRRSLPVILTLILSARAVFAAAGDHEFELAAKAFSDFFWENAENGFGRFVHDFPQSPRVPEAVLYQSEARICLGRYPEAVALLSTNQNSAGKWGDQYRYWTGVAEYRNRNFAVAADAFAQLEKEYPGSSKRLEACIGEAAARGRLGDWARAAQLLQPADSVFQQAAKTNATSQAAVYGWLLLGEAQLAQKHFNQAGAALEALTGQTFNAELSWRREYLRCRLREAQGRFEEALHDTTNLLALAEASLKPELQARLAAPEAQALEGFSAPEPAAFRAESVLARARILERLHRLDEAIAEYQQNMATNVPAVQQRYAMLKFTQLKLEQDKTSDAIQTLQKYLEQFPHAGAADLALLTVGELQLKQYLAESGTNHTAAAPTSGGTNLLQSAIGQFDALTNTFPNSPLVGKALLDKGWCLWTENSSNALAQSEVVFRLAAERLPFSEDQAVARFKWADAQFKLNNFAGATTNYNFLIAHYASLPDVRRRFLERALYQAVRAALDAGDMASATNALRKILDWYPDGFAGDSCLLLTAEGFARQNDPARAGELFAEFERRYPASPLLPEVRLAIARTYEQQEDWPQAIRQYADWIRVFTNHAELPQAEFYRAWDYSMAGQETNAFALFTNLIATFPINAYAQWAQRWIGDYYFNQGRYQEAEKSYQLVYLNTNWAVSELTFQAQMMAGRSAIARLSYSQAIRDYFAPLANDTNCPTDLRAQAIFAWGDALVSQDSTNKPADLTAAIGVFKQISATNAAALGRMASCELQLANTNLQEYADASNTFRQVIDLPAATLAARSQARVGLGLVAEKLAQQRSGAGQTALLNQALNAYLDVLYDDGADPFWRKEAGLKAANIAESLRQWDSAIKVYDRLKNLLPMYAAALDARIARARKNLQPNQK